MNLAANGTSSISMSVEINGIVYAGKGKMQLGLRENGWPGPFEARVDRSVNRVTYC